jgi:hypothetical protein
VAPDEAGQVIVGIDNRDGAGRPVGKMKTAGLGEFRRSLYIQARRSLPLSVLEAFDAPTMTPNCDRRASSTVAPQSLMMMNNDFIIAQSEAFAARLAAEAGPDPAARLRRAFRLALGVEPRGDQLAEAFEFLASQRAELAAAGRTKADKTPAPNVEVRALATFCQAILSSNAFLYVD